MPAHPWLVPLWRRIAVSAACVAWATVETLADDTPWDWIAFGVAVYAIWNFFLSGAYRAER